jgi:hypothetical protein
MRRTTKPSPRVFPYLVDRAAIVDKIVVSVTGKLNETFRDNELLHVDPKSIFHDGGFYAGCIFAKWWLTRNPVKIHHGRMTRFKNVPPLRFTMQSEMIPVTAAQVQLFIKRCTEEFPAPTITLSCLELTFDVTGKTIAYIRRNLMHRAQGGARNLMDKHGNETIYIGSPRSSWQVRIYQKNLWVVRIEFILRKPFLSKYGIKHLEDVQLLRRINIWLLLSVRRFSRSSAKRSTTKLNDLVRGLIVDSARFNRSRETVLFVLRRNRSKPNRIFRRTSLQRKLEAMQRRFIW